MNLRLDRCGWPVVEFRPHRYVHLYPLTIYHLERFAWETGSFTAETAEILGDRERPGAWRAHPADGHLLIATGLCWRTGEEIASWLGGRLPGRGEWMGAALPWKGRPASSLASAIVLDDIAFADRLPPEPAVYLPMVFQRYPPLPYTPTLYEIVNPGGDDNYSVSWSEAALADYYILDEDNDTTFADSPSYYSETTAFSASNMPVGTWYYRVRGCNSWGCGSFSSTRSTTVLPPMSDLYVWNDTGDNLCLEVYNTGIGQKCWSSGGEHYYGSFPVGTYTYRATGCGSGIARTSNVSDPASNFASSPAARTGNISVGIPAACKSSATQVAAR